jgi:RNA polymerase sigma-70 factor, ECF subfamily
LLCNSETRNFEKKEKSMNNHMNTVKAASDYEDFCMQSRTGSEKQNNELFTQEHLHVIYRYVYRHVRNEQDAEDLTSQIFLKAVRGLDLERSALHQQAWLFQVARTTIADYWRVYYRHSPTHSLDKLVEAGWEGPVVEETILESSAAADRVQSILQLLPTRYREVLTYRFLLNLSIRETAARMGLTESNVKVIQSRALKKAIKLDDGANNRSARSH